MKLRTSSSRRDLEAQRQTTVIISDLVDRLGICADGTFSRPVIENYIDCYREKVGDDLELLAGMKLSQAYLEEQLKELAKHSPKRWQDTTQRLKEKMFLLGMQGNPELFTDITFYVGSDLVETSTKSGVPLITLVLKSLHDRMKRKFPELEVGFWLNLERKSYDASHLHVHGLIFVSDARYLQDGVLNRALRREIRAASGSGHPVHRSRVLKMDRRRVNLGWYNYATKQRRVPFIKKTGKREPPSLDTGYKLEATSRSVTQRAEEFYGRAMLVVRGIQTGSIRRWSAKQWADVGAF